MAYSTESQPHGPPGGGVHAASEYPHALLDAIYASAPVGLGFWDRELRFVRVNQRLADMNGLPIEAHIGKTPRELLPDISDIGTLMDQWRAILSGGVPSVTVEVSGATPAAPGVTRYWLEHFFPVRQSGEIIGVGGIVEEITERKLSESALREADRRKDEFLAMLAHELRNPLAPIRNAIELMKSHEPGTQEADLRDIVERQVSHLVRLVDDLLDVSRVTRGKIALKKIPIPAASVVAHAIEMARPLLEAKRQALEISLSDEALWVEADATRLVQAVLNLLSNASKFSEPGGRVRIALDALAQQVRVRVIDEGRGMPPELLPTVFDLFVQGEHSLDRAEGGLGIGLSLVKALVDMHGGTVAAHSAGTGRGSEFIVLLPRCAPPALAAPVSQTDSSVQGRRRRVLVVDDNRDSAESLQMLLQLWGHEAHCAHDGVEALEMADVLRPDTVLLDIGLPGISGYDVARRLRAHDGTAGAMLIAVTGYGQEEDKQLTRDAGFDHHMVKPVDPDALERLLGAS